MQQTHQSRAETHHIGVLRPPPAIAPPPSQISNDHQQENCKSRTHSPTLFPFTTKTPVDMNPIQYPDRSLDVSKDMKDTCLKIDDQDKISSPNEFMHKLVWCLVKASRTLWS